MPPAMKLRPHFAFLLSLSVTLAPLLAQDAPPPGAAAPTPANPETITTTPARESARLSQPLPAPLAPWKDWVLRGEKEANSPRAADDPSVRLSLWPKRLELVADTKEARFSLEVTAFADTWLTLPSSANVWPQDVTLGGQPVPVLNREGMPAIALSPGSHKIAGRFAWAELPQQMKIPPSIGMLSLTVNGEAQATPSWDENGTLWLQRQASSEPVDEDFLSLEVHSLIEDGSPLWFETSVELIVAGKSREETIGSIIPEGWLLAQIDAALPVAIDDRGLLKAQVRAGRWQIRLRSFRTDSPEEIRFAEGVTPAVADQSLAYRSSPAFRQAEIMGLPQIDVAQTQVPDEWRALPIYRWDTSAPFQLVERVRGPGERGAAPLSIQRSLWLDDDGQGLTYQDTLSGPVREIRRLDAAAGHALGSVTVNGEPQLITHNPLGETNDGGTPGFEVRAPTLDAVATGRLAVSPSMSATGWQADADNLSATMHLPPGYRLLALFGADFSQGDWLSTWTLLDLFLLLLFTLAVFRMRGLLAGVLAFVAFGLAYHEYGAPRWPWLFLLIPVALVGVMPLGQWRNLMNGAKWFFTGILILWLAPFVANQVQGALFPQLEKRANNWQSADYSSGSDRIYDAVASVAPSSAPQAENLRQMNKSKSEGNLKADPKAIIQTGPGVPSWTWRTVTYGWSGPVTATQEVRPILLPPAFTRLLAIFRALCLVALAGVLLRGSRRGKETVEEPASGPMGKPVVALLALGLTVFAIPQNASAQFPQKELREELLQHLTQIPDAFPGAAEVHDAALQVDGDRFSLSLEVHAGARCAMALPIPLQAMVPSPTAAGSPESAPLYVRHDGRFWTLLPEAGIHRLSISGHLRDLPEWEWSLSPKPHRVTVAAEGWTVSGLRADGTVEDQILFSRAKAESADAAAASYDRPDTRPALLVTREIELGLVWRVRTTVSRLSPTGRLAALRVPLLTGEKVVSAGRNIEGGTIEIRLGPDATESSWEGELAPANELTLATRATDTWTEQWRLIASPVWNVNFAGLLPTYEQSGEQLTPFWQAWPGESAQISVSRPTAVAGAAVTIDSANHNLSPGRRQRTAFLELNLRTSLGEDFPIQLPAGAEIIALTHDGANIPVRKESDAVVVPLRPGAQSIRVEWRLPSESQGWIRTDAVTLPVEAANVVTLINPPQDRWLLLTQGSQRGPAVRFWAILAFSLIVAAALSRVPRSPLKVYEWLLLSIGLTQVPVFLALFVVAWLFLIRWRGSEHYQQLPRFAYNLCEVGLIFLTLINLGIFIGIASAGLLGNPQMYVAGNDSTDTYLNWFTARSTAELPQPGYWAVSLWWYKLAMLLWALWLAAALVRWLRTGWQNSSKGGHFRSAPAKVVPETPPVAKGGKTPPAIPGAT